MSSEPEDPKRDDFFFELLFDFDEALAANKPPDPSVAEHTQDDDQFRKAQECVRLLERVWPRDGSNSPTVGLPKRPPPDESAPPVKLGRFRVVREIGRGGCGVVFLGRDPVLNRDVAIKIPLWHGLLTTESQQRFLNEAQIAARLDHPHIIPIYESGIDDGIYYIASAFCPGVDLGRWHKNQSDSIPPKQIANLMAVLADAIHHAHQQGVLHRDLKPANVLLQNPEYRFQNAELEPDNQSAIDNLQSAVPKITDFGLAKIIEEDASKLVHTESGAVMGTPQYMAPEQAAGRTEDIDRPTDVYGLGAILYELTTGRPPFEGATQFSVMFQVMHHEPAPPRTLKPGVPRDLETICLKCLNKRPEERYASARELAQDLRRYFDGEPILAQPIGRLERIARWCGKHRALASMLALTSAALVLLVIGGLLFKNANDRRAEAERFGKVKADLAAAETKLRKSAENLATTQKYFALTAAGAKEIASKKSGWTWRGLDKLKQAAALNTSVRDVIALREAVVQCLAGVDVRKSEVLYDNFVASQVAFSPDGRYLAMGEHKALVNLVFPVNVLVMDMQTKKIVKRLQFPTQASKAGLTVRDGCRSLCFSPDGKWLCVGSRSGWIHCWDRTKGKKTPTHSWEAAESMILNLIASPDGNSLYSKDYVGWIRCWKLGTTDHLLSETHAREETSAMCLSPDGDILISHKRRLHYFESLTLRPIFENADIFPSEVCFHPTATLLAIDGGKGRIYLLDSETGKRVREFATPAANEARARVSDMLFNADGSILLTTAGTVADRYVRIWDTASGRLLARIQPGHFGPIHAVFHPSGRSIVIASDKKIVQYEINGNVEQTTLAHQSSPLRSIAWSPDGRRLATYSASTSNGESEIRLWESATGKLLGKKPLAPPDSSIRQPDVVFHPTSDLLVAGGRMGVLVWPFGSDDSRKKLPDSPSVDAMHFSPKGTKLWGLVLPDGVRSWDWRTGKVLSNWKNGLTKLFGNSAALYTMAANEDWVLAGGEDNKMYVLSTNDGKHKKTWSGAGAPLTSAACNQSGTLAVCGTSTGRVLVRRMPGGEIVADFDDHNDFVSAVQFSLDGRMLATASRDATIRIYECNGDNIRFLLTHHSNSGSFNGLTFHPDGRRLATISQNDYAVRIWHLDKIRARLTQFNLADN